MHLMASDKLDEPLCILRFKTEKIIRKIYNFIYILYNVTRNNISKSLQYKHFPRLLYKNIMGLKKYILNLTLLFEFHFHMIKVFV